MFFRDSNKSLNATRAALAHACRVSGNVKHADLLSRMRLAEWEHLNRILCHAVHGNITIHPDTDPYLNTVGELICIMGVMRIPCYSTMEYLMMTHHGVAYRRSESNLHDFDSREEQDHVAFLEETAFINSAYDILDHMRCQNGPGLLDVGFDSDFHNEDRIRVSDMHLGSPDQCQMVHDLLCSWRDGQVTVPTLLEFK